MCIHQTIICCEPRPLASSKLSLRNDYGLSCTWVRGDEGDAEGHTHGIRQGPGLEAARDDVTAPQPRAVGVGGVEERHDGEAQQPDGPARLDPCGHEGAQPHAKVRDTMGHTLHKAEELRDLVHAQLEIIKSFLRIL